MATRGGPGGRWPTAAPQRKPLSGLPSLDGPALAAWHALCEALDRLDGPTACQVHPDAHRLWLAEPGDEVAQQRAADGCAACPARQACLDFALAVPERFGVWGGVLPRERAKRLQAEEQAAKEARREGVESEFVA